MSDTKWDTIKTLLVEDARIWEETCNSTEARLTLTIDEYERTNLDLTLRMFRIYLEAVEHYRDVVLAIEAEDGGTETPNT